MIVVVGIPLYGQTDSGPTAAGTAAEIASSAARAGRTVQFVGKLGEDHAGDDVVLALAKQGVGHVAMLREAGVSTTRGPALEAEDVDLALRYLTDFAVLVLVDRADAAMAGVVAGSASWTGARLIVVVPADAAIPGGLPADAIVFEAPGDDPDGVFANMVGAFAAALDDGDEPEEAFRSTVAAEGWTAATDDDVETWTPDPRPA